MLVVVAPTGGSTAQWLEDMMTAETINRSEAALRKLSGPVRLSLERCCYSCEEHLIEVRSLLISYTLIQCEP